MEFIETFIGFFGKAGETWLGMITGIIPALFALLIFMNSIFKFLGQTRMDAIAQVMAKNRILAYGVLPPMAWMMMSFPGALTIGKLLPERLKLGYQDACCTVVHPLTSLFPHVLPAELFIWLGVAGGLTQLGLPTSDLAVRFILAAVVIGVIRGFITDFIHDQLQKRSKVSEPQPELVIGK